MKKLKNRYDVKNIVVLIFIFLILVAILYFASHDILLSFSFVFLCNIAFSYTGTLFLYYKEEEIGNHDMIDDI